MICNDLKLIESTLKGSSVIFLDIETFGAGSEDALSPFLNSVRIITLGSMDATFVIDMFNHSLSDISDLLHSILPYSCIVGHNLKFDLKTLSVKFGTSILPDCCVDTYILGKMLWHKDNELHAPRGVLSLGGMAKSYCGINMDKAEQTSNWAWPTLTESQIQYAYNDVYILKSLSSTVIKEINSRSISKVNMNHPLGLLDLVAQIEGKYLPFLIEMELSGLSVNLEGLSKCAVEYAENTTNLYESIKYKYDINPSSSKQCLQFLKNRGHKIDSTKDDILATLIDDPAALLISQYRKSKKAEDLIIGYSQVKGDCRLYSEFNQYVGPTGRMSSSKPNVQQVPRNLKEVFYKAPEGSIIFEIDYPGVELRLAAAVAKEPIMIEFFREGKDLHKLTAAKGLGIPIEEVTKEQRQDAKGVNFGFIYGMSAETYRLKQLGKGMVYTSEHCEQFRNAFFELYTGITEWHKTTKRQLYYSKEFKYLKDGTKIPLTRVKSLLGRVMAVTMGTTALNYQVQTSGSDAMKLACVYLRQAIKQSKLPIKIINLVHDAITAEVPKNIELEAKLLIKQNMEKALDAVIKVFHTEVEI